MTKDITYCTRDCANYKCRRNPNNVGLDCNYEFIGVFDNCEEFIPKELIND